MKIYFHPVGRVPKTVLQIDQDLSHDNIRSLAWEMSRQSDSWVTGRTDAVVYHKLVCDKVRIVRSENGSPVQLDSVADTTRHIIRYSYGGLVRTIVVVLPSTILKSVLLSKVATFFGIEESDIDITSRVQSR